MRRLATLVILAIGIPMVLWALNNALSRLARYGLPVKPIAPTVEPSSLVATAVILMALAVVAATVAAAVVAAVRSRRLLGVIPFSELRRHVLIFGPTGSGKTTIALRAVKLAIDRGVKVVVVDWKGEYAARIAGATIIRKIQNIWDVPGSTPRERALIAVELIREMARDVVEVTPPSSLLLLKVLMEEYRRGVPTTERIIRILERRAEAVGERRYAEWNMYMGLIRRLYLLMDERAEDNVEGDPRVVVYDLGGLPSIYLKTLYANYVLTRIYHQATAKGVGGEELRTLVVAEEAQNYVRRRIDELSMGERLVNELRAFGVGVIMISPDPEQLPRHMPKDVGAVISTALSNMPPELAELDGQRRRGVYVLYKERLHVVGRPRPLRAIRVAGATAAERPTTEAKTTEATAVRPEPGAEPAVEEALKAAEAEDALRLELEEEDEGAEAPEPEAPYAAIEEAAAVRESRGPSNPVPG